MKTTVEQRKKDIALLQKKHAEQGLSASEKDQLIDALSQRNLFLEELYALAQDNMFGASSEKQPGQHELFNEAEEIAELEEDEPNNAQDVEPKVKRKRAAPRQLPKDLPREVIVHDIAPSDKICACCQSELHCIGTDVTEKLEFIPASARVIEHHRPKYGCRLCEKQGTSNAIKQAPVPNSVMPKSYATPSLVSQIITSKYQFGLPLYRQEQIFAQIEIELSRKTMSDWVIKIAATLSQLLYEPWHNILLGQGVMRADETPLKVVADDNQKSQMWVYNSGADSPKGNIKEDNTRNIVLYEYKPTRRGQCPVDFLRGYDGYLQVDGHASYHATQARLVGCMAHARRKFIEAQKHQVKGSKKVTKADWAINHIQKLYRVETLIKDMTVEQRYAIRQEKSKPLLDQFKTWLDKSATQLAPDSGTGKAVKYTLNQWEKLIRYTEDGRLNLDNNRSERAVKPFVIGRKNWLFSQTAAGANASAVLYSVIQTAKANGLIPFDYLMHVLAKSIEPDCNAESLMPWNVTLD